MGELLEDAMAGTPAYVGGIQLRPTIDWEMGENDDEAEVRPDRRELAINGRHPAFRTADLLDGRETAEGTDFESLRAVAALTVTCYQCCLSGVGVVALPQVRLSAGELSCELLCAKTGMPFEAHTGNLRSCIGVGFWNRS